MSIPSRRLTAKSRRRRELAFAPLKRHREEVRLNENTRLLVGAGVFMAISALLPWLRVGRLSLTATEVDGEFLLIGGGLIALAGLAGWSSAFTGVLVMTVAAGGLVSAYDVFSSDYSGLAEATDSFVAPAYGLLWAQWPAS